jgi:hypothetical protein
LGVRIAFEAYIELERSQSDAFQIAQTGNYKDIELVISSP